jgi:hypothetical protein
MMPLDRARERYLLDLQFRTLVDSLQALVLQLELTPSEIREAATFACLLIEERRPMSFREPIDPEARRRFEEMRAVLDAQVAMPPGDKLP